MCSVEESSNLCPEKVGRESKRKPCMKCGQPPIVIVRAVDPMCRDCFVAYCTHKFRSGFGKSKLVRDNEKVIVGLSGGPSSTAMLHLIQEGKSVRAQKKLRFIPTVVYIDDGAMSGMNTADRERTCKDMADLLASLGFTHHIFPLEQAVSDNADEVTQSSDFVESVKFMNLEESRCLTERLQGLAANCRTLTAKEALLHTLRQRLLVMVARQLDCEKVLLGDCSTRLAVRMISNITQGRGAHVASEMGFSDSRYKDVMLIRPMRELTSKEVAVYNSVNNLQPLVIPGLDTKMPSNASMDRLTEDFIVGLQTDFPNTTTTVLRTGEKLQPADGRPLEQKCCLCQSPLDTDVDEDGCSALSAILFSQSLSRVNDGVSPGSQSPSASHQDLNMVLCYGCRLVTNDMADISQLPGDLMTGVTQRLTRMEMKNKLSDHLLSADD